MKGHRGRGCGEREGGGREGEREGKREEGGERKGRTIKSERRKERGICGKKKKGLKEEGEGRMDACKVNCQLLTSPVLALTRGGGRSS